MERIAALAGMAAVGCPAYVARAGTATSTTFDKIPESLANLNADLIPPQIFPHMEAPCMPPPCMCLNGYPISL
ncbi:hypothetical protein PF005_g29002 [Phytophthora fragariae]|uniref:Uncharacterized protein n=1 Tax=Phytophthora fragariae TaxID=53985 RepID=A0A6A3DV75_9STRA|nr:hypothetical protein PF003_g40043 [Phytophthora fragariae]KAE8895485.1 hypothetical protein PF003_g20751 [Phytophthora fragariae]KAE8922350.1 hypothetical protein PF009_g27388 [Phytophthora fragariae]KAE8972628.1 hypothetical protein PF011_g25567 [Phytophthora fragariae]KAE9070526.1 hypothetical protein PF007_g26911 [Phytophthora fragariae]